jgi:signal recognition particle subunit SRP54
VNIAREFDRKIGITGIILTKMDGDERGGAVISVRQVTGKPLKFICTGEKIDDIEEANPESIASRILGMGDLRELQERAKEVLDAEKQKEFQEKLKRAELNLEDFLEQIKSFKKMGSMDKILEMIPGGEKFRDMLDDRALIRTEAIINSMTKEERRNPSIIDGSRKRRIAKGSGTSVQEINRLLKEYEMVVQLMKQMKKGKGVNLPFFKGFL